MKLEIRGLVVEKGTGTATSLNQFLPPDFEITELSIRPNLHKAVQLFRDEEFDMCFVAESFNGEDLQAFFSDLRALHKEKDVLIVQVRQELEPAFDRFSLQGEGFAAVVSKEVSDPDKTALKEAYSRFLQDRAIRHKKIDVESAIKLILLEIDKASKNKRRGIDPDLNHDIVSDYMIEQIKFHPEIYEAYLASLEKYLDNSIPFKQLKVEIPEEIAKKNLPKLSGNEYKGVSLRVWDMIRDKFGSEAQEQQAENKTDPSSDTE